MKRVGGLWPEVTAYANLELATWRATRSKRDGRAVARFLERLEPELLALQRDLVDGSYRPGAPIEFEIFDPKRRTIQAAPFRDRVVHHALIDVLEPHLDRRLDAASFACRRGKGTVAALEHARKLVRRFGWFLKLDIHKCFDSLEHDVVLGALARVVKDRDVLALFDALVRRGESGGRGLAIGALTSQWLANLTLGRIDRFVRQELRAPGYVRYMDDFVSFADEREQLEELGARVEGFVVEELHLSLKPRATLLAPTAQGLPFLGWSIRPGNVRLRRENALRSRARLRRRREQLQRGRIDGQQYADAVRAVCAHLALGQTAALRRSWLAREPPVLGAN